MSRKKLAAWTSQWRLYTFLLPALAVLVLWRFLPLYGLQTAFKNVRIGQSLWSGSWVGLANFERFFSMEAFWRILRNTLVLATVQNFVLWPLPIMFALMVHNCIIKRVAKFSQNAVFIPSLLSMVVVVSIINLFCARENGLINIVLAGFGKQPTDFIGAESWYLPLYFISDAWQHIGSNAIIYIAALAAVDLQLVEAARMDGASKLQCIRHIDIPAITPTIVIIFIINTGRMLSIGYEKSLLMQNSLNLRVSEIIGTYVYKVGIAGAQYGFSTAVDFFNAAMGLALVIVCNIISKRVAKIVLY
jgi:putative aldouronate transport system permease protein